MVDRAVADSGFLHHAHDLFKRFEVLRWITVQLHIGNVSRVGERVIGRFGTNLINGADVIIHRHMEAVGVVFAIGNARDNAVFLRVDLDEAAGKSLRGRGQQRYVQAKAVARIVAELTHVADDFKAEVLRPLALAVVLADKRLQAFCQPDEAHGQRAMLEHLAHLIVPAQLFAVDPHALSHQEGIIAHALAALDLEAIQQLVDHQVHHVIQRIEEGVQVVVGLDGQSGQVDGRKAQVAAPIGDFLLGVVLVGHHARAAAHVGNFRFGMPGLIVFQVEGRVLEREVREQALGGCLAGELEQVVVRVAGSVVHAFLHAEDLNGEDGRFAVAQPRLRAFQQVAHHQPRFRRGVHAVINGGKGHLRAGAGIHRVQIVDQRLHGLIGGAVGLLLRLFLGEVLNALGIGAGYAQLGEL